MLSLRPKNLIALSWAGLALLSVVCVVVLFRPSSKSSLEEREGDGTTCFFGGFFFHCLFFTILTPQ